MGEVLQIGPLALPWAPLQLLAAWWIGDALAQRLAARQQLHWGLQGWLLLLGCLVMARATFVLQYTEHYSTPAWGALDIRDGGWTAEAGVATALLYLGVLWFRRSPLLRAAAVGTVTALALWLGVQALRHAIAPGSTPLPAFSAVALDGKTLQLDQLPAQHGQPLVINLWASWCPPCRREMPAMLQAQRQHPGVRFLWVNQGEAPETVLRFAAQHQLPPSQVLLDMPQDLGRLLGSRALPTTVFVDAQGRQTALRVGELSTATLAQQLQALGVAAASVPPSSSTKTALP
ncbi:MAG: TlpA family protein disulfide reductase [Acidovorax sp.]|jgi:thiol-disulfide isomerase/thioredoxin|nr:TlpA family protein disulfide reductase [Acidovorax sp.]